MGEKGSMVPFFRERKGILGKGKVAKTMGQKETRKKKKKKKQKRKQVA